MGCRLESDVVSVLWGDTWIFPLLGLLRLLEGISIGVSGDQGQRFVTAGRHRTRNHAMNGET